MSMKIDADRIRKYKISGIKMLHKEDLPDEYLARLPHCYCYTTPTGDGFLVKYIDHKTHAPHIKYINTGDEIIEQELRFIINMIRASGERLHNINHKNDKKKTDKKENEAIEWTGPYTFEA